MRYVGLARKLEAVQRTQRTTLEGRGWDSNVEMVSLRCRTKSLKIVRSYYIIVLYDR